MEIKQIGQIGIPVKDFERGVAFYKEKLCCFQLGT